MVEPFVSGLLPARMACNVSIAPGGAEVVGSEVLETGAIGITWPWGLGMDCGVSEVMDVGEVFTF